MKFSFFFRRIIWPVCELATWEWRKRMGEGEWGGGRGKGALFVPSTTRWEESLLAGYKSVHAYHDELIQHGDILELRIAIEKQGSMICIGQSLFVQCLTRQNKTRQDTKRQDIMISSATIILSYFSLILTNGEKNLLVKTWSVAASV